MYQTPNIVTNVRPLFAHLLIVVPLIKRFGYLILSKLEHGLGVTTSSLLLAPRGAIPEVVDVATAAFVVLLEVVAVLDVVPRPDLGHHRVHTPVVVSDVPALEEVGPGVLADLLWGWVVVEANCHVDDDVAGVVASIDALVDGAVDVDVPDGAAIGEDVTFPLPWLEHERN